MSENKEMEKLDNKELDEVAGGFDIKEFSQRLKCKHRKRVRTGN